MDKQILSKEEQLKELDRTAKILVRRDFELTTIKETREKELSELKKKTKELEEFKKALLNILEDVEESRVLAEEEKNKTLALILNFSDGILFFDNENKLFLGNIKAENFLDVNCKEIIGRTIEELNVLENMQPLIALIGFGLREVSRQELVVKKDLVLEITTIPVCLEKERLGTLVILHDITREKLIERMKTEFVSIAAHQLRTPLSAVKWILSMFLTGDAGKLADEQKDLLTKTYQSNERMIRLVNSLLDTTRVEEGGFLGKISKLDIKGLIEKITKPFKGDAEMKGLKFYCQIPATSLPNVEVDAEGITLAIQNLLDNALRYTKDGEIKIVLDFNEDENNFLFIITDTGIGISDNDKKRVFSKFFRAANAVKTETEGSGLGLFIVKNIIESHKGKIWFESKEGQGTTFYFTLPAVK